MYALDFSDWHKGCTVEVISLNGQACCFCADHRVLVSVPSVAKKVTMATSGDSDPNKRTLYTGVN